MHYKRKNLIVVDSVYALFLFSLIYKNEMPYGVYVVSDGIDKDIRSRLKNVYYLPSFNKRPFSLIFRLFFLFWVRYFGSLKILLKDIHEYDVFAQDHLFYSRYFIRNDYTLLEDGIGNYVKPKRGLKEKVKEFLNGGRMWGYNSNAKNIILTGLTDVPTDIVTKVCIKNLDHEWNSCSRQQQDSLKKLFSLKDNDFGNFSILLTQPFSEDGVMAESEKIELYRSILNNYSNDVNIIIKPHPREKTNYSLHFANTILSNKFPFQLFLLMHKPKIIVSCFSSAGLHSDSGRVHIYGTVISKKLMERYGHIPSNL